MIIRIRTQKKDKKNTNLFSEAKLILNFIEHKAKKNDIPAEEIEDGKYALCAFFDEVVCKIILASEEYTPEVKNKLFRQSLQAEYFGDSNAGEGFFNKLKQIQSKIETKVNAAEIYYYCMALGFEGKYESKPEKHKELMDSLAFDLKRVKTSDSYVLSPQWKLPKNTMRERVEREIPPWITGVVALFIVFVIFAFLRNSIGNEYANIMKELNGLFVGLGL